MFYGMVIWFIGGHLNGLVYRWSLGLIIVVGWSLSLYGGVAVLILCAGPSSCGYGGAGLSDLC